MGATLANALVAWETYQTILVVVLIGVIVFYKVWKSKQQ